ncbi:hypothetical protein DFJ74DRAFT_467607 [Hyaloraphidium curvatum]|nr:hypothetical protein DFJ74DRAFT_467607 [Hyaloraphidium curvatum]
MPRPFETPVLTGGYRRIPFMQIGADMYCDTNRIAAELERRYPTPSLFPKASNGQANEALAFMLSSTTDRIFFNHVVPQMDWTILPKEFLADRANMRGVSSAEPPKPLDPAVMMAASKNSQQQLHMYLSLIEAQLKSSPTGWFLGTETPHYADLQIFAPVQFIAGLQRLPGSGVAKGFGPEEYPAVWKWHAALFAYADKVKHREANEPINPEDAYKIAEEASKADHFAPHEVEAKADVLGLPKQIGVNTEDHVNARLPNVAEGKLAGATWNATGGGYSVRRDTGKGFDVVVHVPGIGMYWSNL